MIFTWNGRQFQFITDVLGVAPLGASSGDGNYFPVDHDEYVQIPAEALAPVEDHYEVRITEELHEVSYLDQVRLIALDHPRDVEIFTNEKFKSPPFPEFRLFGVTRRISPVAAHDDRGRDVLSSILRRDGIYAGGFRHDYAGVAELHSLTLDLGRETARANKAVLFLNGWVDWADGSTFFGASQGATEGLILPYLQVKDQAGNWRTVIEDMGIPAGKPKTIAVDLSGKFLSASREIRIVTNLCVYWDEIFLSEETGQPPVRLTPLDVESAGVQLRGFSRPVIDERREQPESFDYANWTGAGGVEPDARALHALWRRARTGERRRRPIRHHGSGRRVALTVRQSRAATPRSQLAARFSSAGGRLGQGRRRQHRFLTNRGAAAVPRHEPLSISAVGTLSGRRFPPGLSQPIQHAPRDPLRPAAVSAHALIGRELAPLSLI